MKQANPGVIPDSTGPVDAEKYAIGRKRHGAPCCEKDFPVDAHAYAIGRRSEKQPLEHVDKAAYGIGRREGK